MGDGAGGGADELADALNKLASLLPPTPEQLARATAPGVLKQAALWYASLGWRVFPLEVGGKKPLTTNGFHSASLDVDTITWWWDKQPDANVGTPTGERFDVIDIDAPHGFGTYSTWLESLRSAGHELPPFVGVSYTGNGGRHLLVPPSGKGNGAALGKGLDYRGAGGYIVLPPSRLYTGGLYAWTLNPR